MEKENKNSKLDSKDEFRMFISATSCLKRIYLKYINENEFSLKKIKNNNESADIQKYKLWIYDKFEQFVKYLLKMLQYDEVRYQAAALHLLMEFANVYYLACAEDAKKELFKDFLFPVILFMYSNDIISDIVKNEFNNSYLCKNDIRLYTLEALRFYLNSKESILAEFSNDSNFVDNFLKNSSQILLSLSPVTNNNYLTAKIVAQKDELTYFTAHTWISLLKQTLPHEIYKQLLLALSSTILPCLAEASQFDFSNFTNGPVSPLMLADFLTDSYSIGGVISLLSLNGLFLLIQDYNLDYPNFYKKLYALIGPYVFYSKYKQRFFRLLDLFLSSSYVSAILIAAFTKKLISIALIAPPPCCIYILALVFNLLKRHPTLSGLIHRPQSIESISMELAGKLSESKEGVELFKSLENDPEKSNALQSSLWELKTLDNHYVWEVSKHAKMFSASEAPKTEFDMEEYCEYNYASLMEIEKNEEKSAFNITKPKALFDDSFGWASK